MTFKPTASIRAITPAMAPPALHNAEVTIHRETEHSMVVETQPGKQYLIARRDYAIVRNRSPRNTERMLHRIGYQHERTVH